MYMYSFFLRYLIHFTCISPITYSGGPPMARRQHGRIATGSSADCHCVLSTTLTHMHNHTQGLTCRQIQKERQAQYTSVFCASVSQCPGVYLYVSASACRSIFFTTCIRMSVRVFVCLFVKVYSLYCFCYVMYSFLYVYPHFKRKVCTFKVLISQ